MLIVRTTCRGLTFFLTAFCAVAMLESPTSERPLVACVFGFLISICASFGWKMDK